MRAGPIAVIAPNVNEAAMPVHAGPFQLVRLKPGAPDGRAREHFDMPPAVTA